MEMILDEFFSDSRRQQWHCIEQQYLATISLFSDENWHSTDKRRLCGTVIVRKDDLCCALGRRISHFFVPVGDENVRWLLVCCVFLFFVFWVPNMSVTAVHGGTCVLET